MFGELIMNNDIKKLDYIFRLIDAIYLFRNEKVNDYCKRAMMRSFFIQIDNLTKVAPRVKNSLYRNGVINAVLKRGLETQIQKLSTSYDRSYDVIRDKLGAHSQPIDFLSLYRWWNAIDYSAIEIFYGDIKEIQTMFESIHDIRFLNVSDYSPINIPSNSKLYQVEVVPSIAFDRLGFSKSSAAYMISSHPTQDKAQIILSIIDLLEVDFAVTAVTNNPSTIYTKMIFDIAWMLVTIDLCSLIDNLFENTVYDISLLQYWKDNDIIGYRYLSNVGSQRKPDLESSVRNLRNTFAAHIDDSRALEDIYSQYNELDMISVHDYSVMLINTFRDACRLDIRTKNFLTQNMSLGDGLEISKVINSFEN